MLKALIIGGGGREHVLAWKIAQSPKVTQLYVAPGNAGTAQIAQNLDIRPTDIEGLAKVANDMNIDLTVVGPEAPLATGIVDRFSALGLPIFGPTRAAAKIESSKVFSKQLMQKYGIPCPRGEIFSTYGQAREYLEAQSPPIVIKADGLAAGKGVTVAISKEEARQALSDIMETRVFGSAGDSVIIEECLIGKEVSLLAFTDGKTVIPIAPACDYKRAFNSDQGPNTGGMGSYSPPGFFDASLTKQVTDNILEPTVEAMAKEGTLYKGVLYAGLMLATDGPKVLEFNARFGDPETQVILPRLKSDLVDIILSIIDNKLHETAVEWSNDACVGVVMASGGYPGNYKTGFAIQGLDKVHPEIMIFHAGTKRDENSQICTDGGRVLTVTARGKNMAEARMKVYENIQRIYFEDCHYRKDIAFREVN
ncbi:MAG: phosphoribosylamine--glycine ligase [Chloroflexi bacterium]|nr:phosphoribosylamine--glycine ligase [Chloroflexota bacterium]MBM3174186.1 phosphoribosylamine--glycine ligase [Chloroflexota bacterium]MBM4449817.1 phosphoribosylamine--glycine ligase [Chloroflexota bacterium]